MKSLHPKQAKEDRIISGRKVQEISEIVQVTSLTKEDRIISGRKVTMRRIRERSPSIGMRRLLDDRDTALGDSARGRIEGVEPHLSDSNSSSTSSEKANSGKFGTSQEKITKKQSFDQWRRKTVERSASFSFDMLKRSPREKEEGRKSPRSKFGKQRSPRE